MNQIRTQRLTLKKPTKKINKKLIVSQIGDWEVAKWLSDVPYPYTEQKAEEWLNNINEDDLLFSIFINDSLIGGVGLSLEENNDYDLWFWIGRDYWDKGYATEAAMGLIQFAKKELKLKQIKACHIKGNTGSSNVLRKLGFEEIGECEEFFLSRGKVMSTVTLQLNF
jgi:8-oxo-dGTP diphosphatase|tara:strand:+ start:61 stop:561 length:501 start_codon:yes stop_codon:yes gene_type:complete